MMNPLFRKGFGGGGVARRGASWDSMRDKLGDFAKVAAALESP
jgi:hypothetical protein